MSTGSTGSARSAASGGTAGSAASARSADSVDTLDVAEDLGYATRRASNRPKEPGLVDPAWTRIAFAGIVPLLLAVGSVLPGWARLVLVAVLVPAAAQGWPALV
ncbi:hypothetical protein HMPREF1549_01954, partial [Actinomyces johnsonii F0510]